MGLKLKKKRHNVCVCFTLLELVIVCIVISILAALGLGQYRKIMIKAKAAKAKHAISLIAEAEKMYRVDYGKYLPVSAGWVNAGIGATVTGMNIAAIDNDTSFDYSVTGNDDAITINANNPAAIGGCGAGTPIKLELPAGVWDIPGCYE